MTKPKLNNKSALNKLEPDLEYTCEQIATKGIQIAEHQSKIWFEEFLTDLDVYPENERMNIHDKHTKHYISKWHDQKFIYIIKAYKKGFDTLKDVCRADFVNNKEHWNDTANRVAGVLSLYFILELLKKWGSEQTLEPPLVEVEIKDKLTHKQQLLLLQRLGIFDLPVFSSLNGEEMGRLLSHLLNRNEKNTIDFFRNRLQPGREGLITSKNSKIVDDLLEDVKINTKK